MIIKKDMHMTVTLFGINEILCHPGDTIRCYSCDIVGEIGNSHCADPTKYTDVQTVSCNKCLMDVTGKHIINSALSIS